MIHRSKVVWLSLGAVVVLIALAVTAYMATRPDEPAPPQQATTKPATKSPAELAAEKAASDAASDARQERNAAAVVAMLVEYANNNSGNYPTSETALQAAISSYGKTIAGGTLLVNKPTYSAADAPKPGTINYFLGHSCSGNMPVAASQRSVAVYYALSSGYGCADNR